MRYACRTLAKNPGFTIVAVLTLALGIGAMTAIYSVVDTILLQPLPFADSGRLVRVVENVPHAAAGRPPFQDDVSYQAFLEWRAHTKTLSDTVAVMSGQRMVRTNEGTARLWATRISANAFSLLGTRAMLGRTFDPGDEADPDVVVLSFETWRRLFHSDPAIVGTTIQLRTPDRLVPIVGVLPDGFEFPTGPIADFYMPLVGNVSLGSFSATLIGRLGPGVSLQAAAAEANVIGSTIPTRNANALPAAMPRFEVQSLKAHMVEGLRPALRVFLATVAIVLLIVCANMANLLLARGTGRQREIAIRFALGAGRWRVIRQVLTECVVLAIAGGALGAVFAGGGVMLIKELASVEAPGIFRMVFGPSMLPRLNEVGIDLKMFGIAFGIAGLTSLIFGVLPAVHLSRTDHLLAMGSRGVGSRLPESRVRPVLVVGQLAMATVLLVCAGLLTHSFVKLSAVDKGYDPSNVLAFQLVFPNDYSIARKAATIETMLARLRAVPNVESAGFTRHGIFIPEEILIGTFVPHGRSLEEIRADPMTPSVRAVSHGYLTAIGARLLDGHEFATTDAASSIPAIVISRAVARRYFGEGRAIGQIVDWHVDEGIAAVQTQVVGVVEDVRNESPGRGPRPEIFVDYRRLLVLLERWGRSTQGRDAAALGFLSFAIRTRGDPASAAPMVGQIVRAVDPNAGIDAILPMDRLVASSVARQRFYAVMVGVFAAVAGVLAAIGVYGVLAYAVMQRTQEIGIRMALGAQRAQVLGLVLRKGMLLTIIGIALGLVSAAAGTRFLEGMLFGVTPLDPTAFMAVSVMFVLVAAFACYLPARRATTVDPMVALRCE